MNEFTVRITGLTSADSAQLAEAIELFFLRNKLFEAASGDVHKVDVYEVSAHEGE